MAHEVVESSTVFEGRLLRLRIDHLKQAESIQKIELVEHPGAVAIIPLDDSGEVWFVRQYRHPAGEHLIEIPAGTLNPGEDPVACARRECREEIGMAPGELILLGSGFMAPGYSTENLQFFLARKLSSSALEPDADEELEIYPMPLEQSWDEVMNGRIRDVKTIAGLALARSYLKISKY